MPPLSEPQRRAVTALRDALRRAALEEPTPAPEAADLVPAWLDAVESGLRPVLREARRRAEMAEALAGPALRGGATPNGAEEAPWRRLEEACRRIEQELRAPTTLRTRLDEGRRSMMPRLEHATREKLVPVIAQGQGKLSADLDPEGVASLQNELPGWLHAWTEYAYRWYETDFDRLLDDAWNPRDGVLPVAAPRFADLVAPVVAADIRFPKINIQKEQLSTLGGVFRHGRQGMMMFLGVVGLAGASASDLKGNPLFIAAVAGGAIYVGWSQAASEREKQRETLENDVRTRAEQATRDMLRVWLDRVSDKLNEDARTQLQARRAAFVKWYRTEVVPAQEKSRATVQKNAEETERNRRELPKLQERVRELTKIEEAIRAARSIA